MHLHVFFFSVTSKQKHFLFLLCDEEEDSN